MDVNRVKNFQRKEPLTTEMHVYLNTFLCTKTFLHQHLLINKPLFIFSLFVYPFL